MADVALYITEQLELSERRARRTRRGKKGDSAVKTHMKPIAEAVAGIVYEPTPLERLATLAAQEVKRLQKAAQQAETQADVAVEPAESVEVMQPVVADTTVAVEAVTETTPTVEVEPVTTDVVTPVATQPAHHDVAEGLAENLERAGLVQVHTKPELVTFKGYEVVRYSGRPAPVRADADEAVALQQVHTRPELCKPVVYEAVRYPGRPYTAPAAIAEEPLIQVHTRA